MGFDVAHELKLFTGLNWIDVHVTLLADVLLLVPLQNKHDLSRFLYENALHRFGKLDSKIISQIMKKKSQN